MREIEKIFYQDIYEKKKTATGVFNRASRKGYIKGGMKTQYDFLTAKQKRELNGEVRVMNIYDKYKDLGNLPKYDELKKMIKQGNSEEVRKILSAAKEVNTSSAIQRAIICSSGSLYNLYEKSGVPFERKNTTRSKNKKGSLKNNTTNKNINDEVALDFSGVKNENNNDTIFLERINALLAAFENDKKKDVKNGFNISIQGKYNKKEIEERLINLTGMLIEDSSYTINISITENGK